MSDRLPHRGSHRASYTSPLEKALIIDFNESVAKERKEFRRMARRQENSGCLAGGCLGAGGCIGVILYLAFYCLMIALVIAGVATCLEWFFGFDVPRFQAPDWFGFGGV